MEAARAENNPQNSQNGNRAYRVSYGARNCQAPATLYGACAVPQEIPQCLTRRIVNSMVVGTTKALSY